MDTITGWRLYALALIEHRSRKLRITGVAAHPAAQWATRQARHLAGDLGRRVESLRFVLRDRDSKYTGSFDAVFEAEEIKMLLAAPRSSSDSTNPSMMRSTQMLEAEVSGPVNHGDDDVSGVSGPA